MSSRELYRNPTWAALMPDVPQFSAAPPAVAEMIRGALGLRGEVLQLSNVGAKARLYRLDGSGEASKFVKAVASARIDSVLRAEAIARWLDERGIDVACAEGAPVRADDGTWLFVYPFEDGGRIDASPGDMSALGQAVGELHGALALHPDRGIWEQLSRARLNALAEVRREIVNRTVRAGPDPDQLAEIAGQQYLDFFGAGCTPTPLHGDLNPHNILKHRTSGKPVFLDFEDTFHSVLPPEFELGLLAERNVLVRVEDDRAAAKLITTLFGAYKAAGGSLGPDDLPRIPDMLKSLSFRSLCVLADCEQSGVKIIDSEWRKFFDLFKLAEARRKAFAPLI